jgi:hypothetical protein
MKNKQIYVERNDAGKYAAKLGGAAKASTVQPTQKAAIDEARRMHPGAPIHVERVRDAKVGGRDQWRNP